LLDWLLPGTNGATFARRVRAEETRLAASVLIVLVTGHADQKIVAEAKECGADTILVKPVSVQQLESRIKAALVARAAAGQQCGAASAGPA
jgi:DNA-binding response OmpR family regulator